MSAFIDGQRAAYSGSPRVCPYKGKDGKLRFEAWFRGYDHIVEMNNAANGAFESINHGYMIQPGIELKADEAGGWKNAYRDIVLGIIALTLLFILIEIYRIEDGLDQFRPVRNYVYQKGAMQWDVISDSVTINDTLNGKPDIAIKPKTEGENNGHKSK